MAEVRQGGAATRRGDGVAGPVARGVLAIAAGVCVALVGVPLVGRAARAGVPLVAEAVAWGFRRAGGVEGRKLGQGAIAAAVLLLLLGAVTWPVRRRYLALRRMHGARGVRLDPVRRAVGALPFPSLVLLVGALAAGAVWVERARRMPLVDPLVTVPLLAALYLAALGGPLWLLGVTVRAAVALVRRGGRSARLAGLLTAALLAGSGVAIAGYLRAGGVTALPAAPPGSAAAAAATAALPVEEPGAHGREARLGRRLSRLADDLLARPPTTVAALDAGQRALLVDATRFLEDPFAARPDDADREAAFPRPAATGDVRAGDAADAAALAGLGGPAADFERCLADLARRGDDRHARAGLVAGRPWLTDGETRDLVGAALLHVCLRHPSRPYESPGLAVRAVAERYARAVAVHRQRRLACDLPPPPPSRACAWPAMAPLDVRLDREGAVVEPLYCGLDAADRDLLARRLRDGARLADLARDTGRPPADVTAAYRAAVARLRHDLDARCDRPR